MAEVLTYRVRFILDVNKQVGNHAEKTGSIKSDLCKEEVSRKYIFCRPGVGMKFLDIGARDGGLIVTIVPFAQRFHESPDDYF